MAKKAVTSLCSMCKNAADASSLLECIGCRTMYHERCRKYAVNGLPDIGNPYTWRNKTKYYCLYCTYPRESDNVCCEKALCRIKRHNNEGSIDSEFARKVFRKENNLFELVYELTLPKPFKTLTGLVGKEDVKSREIIANVCASLLESYSPRATVLDVNSFYRSLSLGLYGNEIHHTELRLACVLEILNHSRFYEELTRELEMIDYTYFEMIKKACDELSDLPQFYAASTVIGKEIISLGRNFEIQNDKCRLWRLCKRRIAGRAVLRRRDYIIVMWTLATDSSVVERTNFYVLLQALPGVQNPSAVLDTLEDMEINVSTEELDETQESSDGDGKESAPSNADDLEVIIGSNFKVFDRDRCESGKSDDFVHGEENVSYQNGANPSTFQTLKGDDLETITDSNTMKAEEDPCTSHLKEVVHAGGNVSNSNKTTLSKSCRLETTETTDPQHQLESKETLPAVGNQIAEVPRCYHLLEMVESEMRLGNGRKQRPWRDLKEFLTVLSQGHGQNPLYNDSLTAYCTELWLRDEFVQTLALLCAWLDLFPSAKSADENTKFDMTALYIDYLAVTSEKLVTMGGQNRKIAIEFGLPILKDAFPKLRDTKINIVEQISVAKIRRIVSNIYRKDGKNPPWESKETSRTIQLLHDQLQRPLDAIGYAKRARILSNLMKIQENLSADDLVKVAVCELYLNRGRGKRALRDLRDALRSCSVIGRLSTRAKIKDLWNTEHHMKLFIYAYVWCDMFIKEESSDDSDYEDTVLQSTVILELSMRKLVATGGEEQRIAMEYGVPKLTNTIRNLSRSRIVNDQITFLQKRVVIYKRLHVMEYVFDNIVNLRNIQGVFASPVDDASISQELNRVNLLHLGYGLNIV